MARKSGLGKGLDALIPPAEGGLAQRGAATISVKQIHPNPRQPRSVFGKEELAELAASIKQHGVLQPIIVMQGKGANQYVLIAGERRLQAARQAKMDKVPVILREASDQESLEIALIENVQRTDLSPLEAAKAYQQLKDEFNLSDEKIAERVGKSRVAITNTRTLLEMSMSVKEALGNRKISEGHARALKALSRQSQSAALQTVVKQNLNVRQTEELARKLKGKKPASKRKAPPPPEIIELQGRLRDSLGTKVSLSHGAKGGKIVIHYFSDEQLNGLADRLTREK
ncbi:MAG: ParB/RepB/Spo0J family partition protein [Chloroflexi bacterium]|nr:ParB/RepB/Spo0J family partition protein [Chloroflexota bacterium]